MIPRCAIYRTFDEPWENNVSDVSANETCEDRLEKRGQNVLLVESGWKSTFQVRLLQHNGARTQEQPVEESEVDPDAETGWKLAGRRSLFCTRPNKATINLIITTLAYHQSTHEAAWA